MKNWRERNKEHYEEYIKKFKNTENYKISVYKRRNSDMT